MFESLPANAGSPVSTGGASVVPFWLTAEEKSCSVTTWTRTVSLSDFPVVFS